MVDNVRVMLFRNAECIYFSLKNCTAARGSNDGHDEERIPPVTSIERIDWYLHDLYIVPPKQYPSVEKDDSAYVQLQKVLVV